MNAHTENWLAVAHDIAAPVRRTVSMVTVPVPCDCGAFADAVVRFEHGTEPVVAFPRVCASCGTARANLTDDLIDTALCLIRDGRAS